MRQKRAKTYRKLMSLYSLTFGFRQPYQVLVDSEMCKAAVALKDVDFIKQLGTNVQGTVKPMITQCCIHELYLQWRTQQPAIDLAKNFERRMCNHKEAIPGDECLLSVIGDKNKHRYVVATQSNPLRSKLRSIPAVPVLHMNRSVMILEPPSETTLRAKALVEQEALDPSGSDASRLKTEAPPAEPPKKKRKGPKGPNPLSVKKKRPTFPPAARKVKDQDQRANSRRLDDNDEGGDGSSRSKTGEKRKRDDVSHDPQPLQKGGDEQARTEGGHKRKRRRKGGS